ncbi:MAG: hypothetical protein LBC39_08325 [Methanobrevibacter sp.]|jgi:hypothetical protein|nr:hypothetical protein [Candidatus Methanovirga aequatorialis]
MKIKNVVLALSMVLILATTLSTVNALRGTATTDGWDIGVQNHRGQDVVINVDGEDYNLKPNDINNQDDEASIHIYKESVITYNGYTIPALASNESIFYDPCFSRHPEKYLPEEWDYMVSIMRINHNPETYNGRGFDLYQVKTWK